MGPLFLVGEVMLFAHSSIIDFIPADAAQGFEEFEKITYRTNREPDGGYDSDDQRIAAPAIIV